MEETIVVNEHIADGTITRTIHRSTHWSGPACGPYQYFCGLGFEWGESIFGGELVSGIMFHPRPRPQNVVMSPSQL